MIWLLYYLLLNGMKKLQLSCPKVLSTATMLLWIRLKMQNLLVLAMGTEELAIGRCILWSNKRPYLKRQNHHHRHQSSTTMMKFQVKQTTTWMRLIHWNLRQKVKLNFKLKVKWCQYLPSMLKHLKFGQLILLFHSILITLFLNLLLKEQLIFPVCRMLILLRFHGPIFQIIHP
uniref:Uncharacterized protein n=1 Tax=Arundo donax TaxID=35708 RepID=A0A0A9DKV2_ARUDO